jgi:tRNA(Ile)-lysidine synthase
VHALAAAPRAGESVEAWARRSRYRALREMALARGVDLVLLAHHRRDQAETFLLQALRGGGVAALSAMPKVARRDGVTWARRGSATPREAIEAYARRHRLRWIDDDSNDDDRFARNRLRRHVWPALVELRRCRGLAGRRRAARPGRRCRGRRDRAADARRDRRRAASISRLARALGRTPAPGLAAMAAQRARDAPPASLVERLMDEAIASGRSAAGLRRGELRSYRGRLHRYAAVCDGDDAAPVDRLSRPGRHEIAPWRRRVSRRRASSRAASPSRRSRTPRAASRARPATASRPARDGRRAA